MRPRVTFIVLLCLMALVAVPSAADASSGQLAIFQDDRRLVESGTAARRATLAELRGLGVDVIKVSVGWAAVAPGTTRKPPGFDATNPSGYDLFGLDGLVREAQAMGFQVMLTPTTPAPGWATARRGDRFGVYRPSATEYRRFVTALGRRYGSVRMWSFITEPNHPRFLSPQATRSRRPYSPHLYRRLVRGGVAGLRASGHAGDRTLFGELLPIGKRRVFRRNTMKPLRFLREFFCVNRRFRRLRGRAARARGCHRFRRITGVNGFAYHPYTRPNGPRGREPSRDDATIRSLRRITRTLDRARRRGRLGGPRRMRVWNTEFGYQSNPPDRFQTRLGRIPRFLNESEWITFRNRRVASYSQFTLTDIPISQGIGTWQGGLRFASGSAKPGVYNAYRLPLFVRLLGPRAVEVWGAARPGGRGAVVQIQSRRRGGSYTNLGGPITVGNSRGYFRRRFRLSRAARRSYRFRYGGLTSRSAKAVVR